jgi:transposase-like protein
MLCFKGMRFPIDVILACIRWYAAYPLSYRHLEEMMEARGVSVDHSTINRWVIQFLPLIENRLGGNIACCTIASMLGSVVSSARTKSRVCCPV